MERNQQRIVLRVLWLARAIAIGVLLLAVVVLAGWVLDNPLFKGALPGQVAMKANTAVGFGLSALALWLLAGRAAPSRWQQVALGSALVVAALGAVSLIEYLLGANLGIDQLLFREPVGAFGTSNPGRMAPLTAVCFILLGAALWFVTQPRMVLAGQASAVLVAVIGLLNLIGYVYEAEGLYKLGPYTPMAMPTAVAFLALGVGVLSVRPEAGLMRTVTSDTAGGVVARRLLLVAVLVPMVLGWLRLQGQRAGLYDTAFGVALTAVANILVLAAVVWWIVQLLERSERERLWAKDEYHTILEAAIDGFWVVDKKRRLLEVNEAYCRMTGYSPDELLRMHVSDLEATDTPDEIMRNIGRVMAKGSDRFERRHRRKDGSIFEVDISVQYLDLRSGIFICFLQDITQRKQAEEYLRDTNAQLDRRVRERTAQLEAANQVLDRQSRLLAQTQTAAKIGGWELDLVTHQLYWTEETYRIHELTPEHFTPTLESAINFYAPESRPVITAAIQAGMEEGREWDLELELITAKQQHIWVRASGKVQVADGQPIKAYGAFQDITQRKQAEADLRLQGSALKSAANAIIITDRQGIIQWINPAFTQLTGYVVTEAVGRNPRELVKSGKHNDAFYQQMWATILDGGVWQGETINRRKDGTLFTEFQTITPVRDKHGKISHFIAIKEDITERRQTEAEKLLIGEIIQGVTTTPNLDELLNLVHRSISKLLYAENCFVALHDETTNLIHFEYWVDKFDPVPLPHPLRRGFASYVLRTNQPLLLTEELKRRMYGSGEVEKSGRSSASWLGVPLRTPARAIGVLVIQHYEDKNAYTQRDLELLSSVGDQIALAIERKRAEEQLRRQLDFTETITTSLGEGLYAVDIDNQLTFMNPAAEAALGWTEAELLGRKIHEIMHFQHADGTPHSASECPLLGVLKSGNTVKTESDTFTRKDGNVFPVSYTSSPIVTEGKVVGAVNAFRDITERKQAEEALHASERRYRDIFTFAPVGIYQSLRDGTLVTANQALAGMLGYDSVDELLEVNLGQVYLTEDDRDRLIGGYEDRGYATDLELQWKRKDGTPIWIQLAAHAIKGSEGLTEYFEGFVRDVTDRKRAVEALRESEERYRDLVENAHDIIYTHDLSGNYTSMNKAGEAITGYTVEEALKLNLSQTVAPEYVPKAREMVARKLAGERVTAYEMEIIARDGHRITVEANTKLVFQNGVPVGVQGIARDVTERKQLEEQLRQSQKMEAIGRLAGGVAHDFNNLLTAINGYSSLALQRIDDNHPLRNYLEEIKKAGDRAANLTRQLLAFGRKQILQPLAINLNDVVTDMNKMLRRLIGEDVELTAKLDPALKRIKADPGQIEQVLVNLVVNARDAMPQGGNLTIETSAVDLDGEYAGRHVGVVPGRYVMLAVSDTGTGMDEKTKARIFDPFFTTKEKGKGTGLGLSTVYGIIKQSGGNVWVYSELGHGTSFKVYLPELATPERIETKTVESPIPRGSETILLVEDEDVVRGLARKILEQAGYNVLEANRGEEAVRLCLERAGSIDLLLTDVVMPETSGKEVADRLTELRPGLRVLFMSGYTDEAIVHHGVLDSDVEFIQKPFTPAALAKKVREVLDSELIIGDSLSLLPVGEGLGKRGVTDSSLLPNPLGEGEGVGFEPSPDSLPGVEVGTEIEQEHHDA